MEKLPLELTKLLYMRFASTYGEKFTRTHTSDQFVQLWWEEWSEGMAGIEPAHIKDALSYCRLNLEWPPSIAEFRRLCERQSGIPSLDDAFHMAIRRDFSHPIIAIAYDHVGSWAMKNDKDTILLSKFQEAYTKALNQHRTDPQATAKYLESFQERIALPPPPDKIPTQKEIISWRERMEKYKEMANAAKLELKEVDHPTWDTKKINVHAKDFDEKLYNERKRYLIGLDDLTSMSLPMNDRYDRIKYLREIEGMERIKNNPPRVESSTEKNRSTRSYSGARRAYDKWTD